MAIAGARVARPTWWRRLAARAIASDLTTFVVPGAEVARAHGLDLAASGLRLVPTPRHASVLLVVGELPEGLARAAAVAYAQMPRPRAVLAMGTRDVAPVPTPDVVTALDQEALTRGVVTLCGLMVGGAFDPSAVVFDVPAVRMVTEYTCPMHPEIVRDAPGRCPLCGMDLVPRERAGDVSTHTGLGHGGLDHTSMGHDAPASPPTASGDIAYTCPMHPGIVRDAPGRCTKCGMDLVPRERAGDASPHAGMDHASMSHEPTQHDAACAASGDATYTCPMHAEIVRGAPGRCPICGMDLVPRDEAASTEDHAALGHGAPSTDPSGPSYACPMHPDIVRDAPGRCPKCGMDLVPRERTGGASDHADMGHGAMEHASMEHDTPPSGPKEASGPSYTCPMHPEIVRDAPGRCPKCGMDLVPRDAPASGAGHVAMGHGGMDGPETGRQAPDSSDGGDKHLGMDHDMTGMSGFMSMVAITKDLPRSRDGLPMEWIDAPFGPLFPGLPGGLGLALTLDGDEVARVALDAGVASRGLAATWPGAVATFPERLARLDPEARIAYRLLALRAIESATVTECDSETARGWIGALERERALSHLNWLASWGLLLGTPWLADRAAALRLALSRVTGMDELAPVADSIGAFTRSVERMPLLRQRLGGVGSLAADTPVTLRGPVARASAAPVDARSAEPAYLALGFESCAIAGDDALARMRVRLAELEQSLALIRAAGTLTPPGAKYDWKGSVFASEGAAREGRATVETARGAASITLKIAGGAVREVVLDLPSVAHATLLDALATGQELGNALAGIASLDLSPWELGA